MNERIVALDIGDARIGVAVSDAMRLIASPVEVIRRVGFGPDVKRVQEICRQYDTSIVLSGLLIWWIASMCRKNRKAISQGIQAPVPVGVLVGLTLITAGAIGNVIDCLFYGIIWDYAPLMFGKVVDMFYFPIIRSGERVLFFNPVFNFADSCVTVGAFYLLLFHWRFFAQDEKKDTKGDEA